MNQLVMDIPLYKYWIPVNKADDSCRQLADRHYSRQTIGAKLFTRPGKNIVLRTILGDAVWVSWQGIRDDGLEAYECTIFRNESDILSSELIKEAMQITVDIWGDMPKDGFITTVKAEKVKSKNPGCCFKKSGFKYIGKTKVNKLLIFQYLEG
jgi:DNA polymerase I-like protein with 3'-5' exonuclease and polymerase domains